MLSPRNTTRSPSRKKNSAARDKYAESTIAERQTREMALLAGFMAGNRIETRTNRKADGVVLWVTLSVLNSHHTAPIMHRIRITLQIRPMEAMMAPARR